MVVAATQTMLAWATEGRVNNVGEWKKAVTMLFRLLKIDCVGNRI